MTKFFLCFKRGCPYCKMVQDKIDELGIRENVEICYADEDFSVEDFKKKYGQEATFPLGMIVEDDKKVLRIEGGSEEIMEKMQDFKDSMSG